MEKKEIIRIFDDLEFMLRYEEYNAITGRGKGKPQEVSQDMPFSKGDIVADIGCGTGKSSLVIFEKQPEIKKIIAVDPCKNVLDLAKLRFGNHLSELLSYFSNAPEILTYDLANSYQEAQVFKNKIEFYEAFAENLEEVVKEEVDHVVASLSLHWFYDSDKGLKNINRILKKEGSMAVSSASWKYKFEKLDRNQSFNQNPFYQAFFKNLEKELNTSVDKSGIDTEKPVLFDYKKAEELFESKGFEITNYREHFYELPPGMIILACRFGAFLRMGEINLEITKLDEIINETTYKTLKEVNILDSDKKYEMAPYFTVKKVKD